MSRPDPILPFAEADAEGVDHPRRLHTVADAEELLLHLIEVMEALLAVVEEETRLVRAGRSDTAARLQRAKADLARLYMGAIADMRANRDFLRCAVPNALAALRSRHDTFRALLQMNLAVLACESAVADGRNARAPAPTEPAAWAPRDGGARRRLPPARSVPAAPPPRAPTRLATADNASLGRRRAT